MKLFAFLTIFMAALYANAVAVDKFSCKFSLKEFGTDIKSIEETEINVPRLPLSLSPSPDARLTAGSASWSSVLMASKGSINSNLTFYYKHAVKTDQAGAKTAYEDLCFAITADFCEKTTGGSGGDAHTCSSSSIACLEQYEPENPFFGWIQVGLDSLGTPLFSQMTPIGQIQIAHDKNGNTAGSAEVSCQYKGTFQ